MVRIASPKTLEDTGLPRGFVEELTLQSIDRLGRAAALELSQELCLPFSVMKDALDKLRADGLCEVTGAQGFGEQMFEYVLTDSGRRKAIEALSRCAYAGPAPVPFSQYLSVESEQHGSRRFSTIGRDALVNGLQDLVVTEGMLRTLGPALNSAEPVFLYGPPGNGKTSLALALGNLVASQDPIWIPRAIEVGRQIIRVFDATVHELVGDGAEPGREGFFAGLAPDYEYDQRWVLIRRPLVLGGAETTMANFELARDQATGVYAAPYQWKANGGTLFIDDFGRQAMAPQQVLDRWVGLLEGRQDRLTLLTGQTIEIPLYVRVLLATNLHPAELMDEAYLRRLRYRIYVPRPSPEQYRRIFRNVCVGVGLEFVPETVDHLFRCWYDGRGIEARACHPRDIVAHILDICRYEDLEPALEPALVDQAASFCFDGGAQDDTELLASVDWDDLKATNRL